MELIIKGTPDELKKFGIYQYSLLNQNMCTPYVVETKKEENNSALNDGIFKEKGRITLRHNGKGITIADKNCGGDDKLFTRDEAVKHCKRLKSMHLPTIEERSELLNLWCEWKGYKYRTSNEGLVYVRDTDNDNKKIGKEFAEDLKLPFAGYRSRYNARVYNQGSHGHYWSSSPVGGGSNYARNLNLYSNGSVYSHNTNYRANGFSVRCFKNSYGS